MKRFRNVLLIADRHEQSNAFFDWAVTFIKTNRACLTVLDVLKIPPPEMLMQLEAFNPQELQESVVKQRLMELQQLIAPFQADGYRIAVKVLLGTPFLEIIREVLLNSHDLV